MQIAEMERKNPKKVFCFKENIIWIGENKFSESRKGNLALAANLLRNTPKI